MDQLRLKNSERERERERERDAAEEDQSACDVVSTTGSSNTNGDNMQKEKSEMRRDFECGEARPILRRGDEKSLMPKELCHACHQDTWAGASFFLDCLKMLRCM